MNHLRIAAIAAVSLGAAGVALAGGASEERVQQNQTGMQQAQSSGSSGMQQGQTGSGTTGMKQSGQRGMSQDAIVLTEQQKQTIAQRLGMKSQGQQPPSGFQASVGATVPNNVSLQEVPDDVSDQVPAVANFRYFSLGGDRLALVDPDDRRIVSIIEQSPSQKPKNQ